MFKLTHLIMFDDNTSKLLRATTSYNTSYMMFIRQINQANKWSNTLH